MSDSLPNPSFSFSPQAMLGLILKQRYQLKAYVSKGGTSWVYRAIDLKTQRPCAVKILLPSLLDHPKLRRRFQDEALVQTRLRHPNIVQFLDYIEEQKLIALAMEWIQGEELLHLLQRIRGPVAPDDLWQLMWPILSALSHAHKQGIIHRDLKPDNILLQQDREEDLIVPKLADFGIAKLLRGRDPSVTKTGIVIGTYRYMAPEQLLDSKRVDHRADIYSIGIILYIMATGKIPFSGAESNVIYGHLSTPPTPPHQHNPSIPPGLEEVILTCLQKDPQQRYQTCEALSRAFTLALLREKNPSFESLQGLDALQFDQFQQTINDLKPQHPPHAMGRHTPFAHQKSTLFQIALHPPTHVAHENDLHPSPTPLNDDIPISPAAVKALATILDPSPQSAQAPHSHQAQSPPPPQTQIQNHQNPRAQVPPEEPPKRKRKLQVMRSKRHAPQPQETTPRRPSRPAPSKAPQAAHAKAPQASSSLLGGILPSDEELGLHLPPSTPANAPQAAPPPAPRNNPMPAPSARNPKQKKKKNSFDTYHMSNFLTSVFWVVVLAAIALLAYNYLLDDPLPPLNGPRTNADILPPQDDPPPSIRRRARRRRRVRRSRRVRRRQRRGRWIHQHRPVWVWSASKNRWHQVRKWKKVWVPYTRTKTHSP